MAANDEAVMQQRRRVTAQEPSIKVASPFSDRLFLRVILYGMATWGGYVWLAAGGTPASFQGLLLAVIATSGLAASSR